MCINDIMDGRLQRLLLVVSAPMAPMCRRRAAFADLVPLRRFAKETWRDSLFTHLCVHLRSDATVPRFTVSEICGDEILKRHSKRLE